MSEPTPESTRNNQTSPHVARWVRLRPSRWLRWTHHGLLLALSLLPLSALLAGRPTLLHWLLFLMFATLLAAEYGRFRRGLIAPPEAVSCEKDGSWSLFWGERRASAEPTGESVVWPWLQVLPLRDVETGRRHTLIVLPDCAGADDRRRLRLWMRLGRG